MKITFSTLLILCGLWIHSAKIQATETQPETSLLVASGNFAPYFVDDNPATLGLFNDIFKEALAQVGYPNVEFKSLGNEAIKRNFLIGRAEVALNWGGITPDGFFQSKYRLKFVNRVIVRKASPLALLQDLSTMKGFKVVSFVNATRVFGLQYENTMKNNGYIEYEDQTITNRLFISERFDAKVGDWLMFLWSLGLTPQQQQNMPYTALDLLEYSGSSVIYKDEVLRDKVDMQLTTMLQSGQIETITQNWFKSMGVVPYQHQFLAVLAKK
ncbi:transporter substrate-binding domain-containing protein [Pseudoalteromonas tunicata]|uniref:transporter substrate-binding domain-containing protein n=1 Tax=Pseudoalteromonas tunicata TaxID=314281 RepID=UPI00273F88C2|nr:transporter substrate-binding domain-containing protein [Pseudoalteromonas tunicata]MDP4985105.1 transporter substrate-binding domain-containing protein [Pseudoalteromonas tunicata]